MTINIPDFIATIGPDAADMLLELLEIGEMRMVADAEAADPEDVDYDIARLRLGWRCSIRMGFVSTAVAATVSG
jgi:hypothetical protein